jgi:hypothetical protein
LAALILLVVQFGLGMVLNLYVPVPSSDQHAGISQEISTAPTTLTIHVLLGLGLICAAMVLLARAISVRDPVVTFLAAAGLGAIAGAFAAGEVFVRTAQTGASLTMAILTGAALLCYIGALAHIGAVSRQTAHMPPHPPAWPRPRPDTAYPPGTWRAAAPGQDRPPWGPVKTPPSEPEPGAVRYRRQ